MLPLAIGMRQLFCAFACALLISGCVTKSHEWQQHTEDEFPTRVNWIISQVGNVLDAKRGLRYGTWTVTSGKGGPLATYQCPQGGICEINISNLQCQQATGGQTACELVLYKNAICELVVPEKKETLEIGCPIQVALKPKGEGETASPKEAAATAAAAAAAAAAAKGAQEAAGVAPTAPKEAPEAAGAPPTAPKKAEEPAGAAPTAPKKAEEAAPTAKAQPAAAAAAAKAAQEAPPITPATEAKGAAPKEAACRSFRTGEGPIRWGRLCVRLTRRTDRPNPTDTGGSEQRHLRRASDQSRRILRPHRMGTAGNHVRMATIQDQWAWC